MTEKTDSFYTSCVPQIEAILDRLEENLTGSKNSNDLEYIHQSRVNSRRLRAALQLFAPCLDKKMTKQWRASVKQITQSLGEVRDTDVQIKFLEEIVNRDQIIRPGVYYILVKQKDKRTQLQENIDSSIQEFINAGTISEIKKYLAELQSTESYVKDEDSVDLYKKSLINRMSNFLSFDQYVYDETAVIQHHQLRIAAKRLRYTMELLQDHYEPEFKSMIDTIKGFQDQLGSIHDTDVWKDYLPEFIKKYCTKLPVSKRSQIIADLDIFSQEVNERRNILFRDFSTKWRTELDNGFFNALRGLVILSSDTDPNRKKTLSAVRHIAQKYDVDPKHSKQVTNLSLNLFDELIWLHNLSGADRELLEYAAMLHDIGWYRGRDDHNYQSQEMILSDANLPFRCDIRLMIALIARYHKKGTPSRSDKGYALLLSGEADRVDKLSAIIRVADGLDASHSNVVKSIKAKDEEDQVWLECQVDLDYTMEEDAIRKKKNLFKKIFKKPLKIEWKTA